MLKSGAMQVSVIIPTYNRARTLGRAIDSVLNQKGAEFELIIVDDGSTDETRSLIEMQKGSDPFSKRGLTPFELRYFHQPNRGPAAARNRGILQTSGEFIAFLDSDDEWLPGKLKAQLRYFEENPEILICQTEEIWIRNGVRVNPMKKHKKYGGSIFENCLPLCIVSPSAVMMRREFFDLVGLFDESFPACEDYELWLRASAKMPIGLIEKSYVVKYGGHADQRSKEFPVMDRFRIRAIEKILASGILSEEQIGVARHQLELKWEIVRKGAEKRGIDSVVILRAEGPKDLDPSSALRASSG